MRITRQTTYNIPALTVGDLARGVAALRESSGDCEIIQVEGEYSWVEDPRTGERKNVQGIVSVTVQEDENDE